MKPCCSQPYLFKAWLPCWPFAATYCRSCGEVVATFGDFLNLFWDAFVFPFTGTRFRVRVTNIRIENPRGKEPVGP